MTAGRIAVGYKRPFGTRQGAAVSHINKTANFIHPVNDIIRCRADLGKRVSDNINADGLS